VKEEETRRKLPPWWYNIAHSGVSERGGNGKEAASLVVQYSILHLPHSTKLREEEERTRKLPPWWCSIV